MYTLLIDVKEDEKQISNNGKSEMQVHLVALTISCS